MKPTTMDIFTPWGCTVIYANPEYGDPGDQEHRGLLVLGKSYRMVRSSVEGDRTEIWLEGIRGSFNSVLFQNIPQYRRAETGEGINLPFEPPEHVHVHVHMKGRR
jgi:hypothetical protein